MPNMIPAAAEGVPAYTRRSTFLVSAAALTSALATLSAPVAMPPHLPVALQRILTEYAAAHRVLAGALSKEQKAIGKPSFARAERAADAAIDRMAHAFRALIEHPCDGLADIRAKVSVLLAAPPAFGGELEYAEARTLLASFTGGSV